MSGVTLPSGGGGGAWGDITGTLSDQTDLQTALDAKVNDTGNETVAGIKTFSSAPIFSALTASNVPYLNASKAFTASSIAVDNTTLALTITPTGAPTSGVAIVGGSLSGHTNTLGVSCTFGSSGTTRGISIDVTHGSGSGGGHGLRIAIGTGGTSSGQIRGVYSEITGAVSGYSIGWGNSPTGNCGYSAYVTSGGNTSGSAVGFTAHAAGGNGVVGVHGYASGGIGANARAYGVRGIATTQTGSGTARSVGVFGKIGTTDGSTLESSDPGISAGGLFSNGDTTADILNLRDDDTEKFVVEDGGTVDMSGISAGVANFRFTATSDTPTVTWGAAAGNEASTAPAGYVEISVGGNARYIPFWA